MDELDDLINSIVEPQAERKPQPKAEASVIKKTKKAKQPESKWVEIPAGQKVVAKEQTKEEAPELEWKQIPMRKRNPRCGFCKKKLHGGEWHWMQMLHSDENRKHLEAFWWCKSCMAGICIPPTQQ